MPSSLLGSQFDALEDPGPDEHPITVSVSGTVAKTVLNVLEQLAGRDEQLPNR
jgi:gluconate kinase